MNQSLSNDFKESEEFGASSNTMIEAERRTDDRVEVVFGEDERCTQRTNIPPYSSICSLIVSMPGGNQIYGTGFFVSPYVVLTAAHNLFTNPFNAPSFQWAESVSVIPGRNLEEAPFGCFESSNLRVSGSWLQNHGEQNKSGDYGCIIIPSHYNIDPAIGYFALLQYSIPCAPVQKACIAGFPYDGEIEKYDGRRMYFSRDNFIAPMNEGDSLLAYKADTSPGQSGSPVWIEGSRGPILVGIHVEGNQVCNQAVRLTSSVIAEINGWISESQQRQPIG